MVDYKNVNFTKMKEDSSYAEKIEELLLSGEKILLSSKSAKLGVVFTTRRVFIINAQGLRGKKIDATSLPYKSLRSYAVETSGSFDKDIILTLALISSGKVVFELHSNSNILEISRCIAQAIL